MLCFNPKKSFTLLEYWKFTKNYFSIPFVSTLPLYLLLTIIITLDLTIV